jgi:hypothetical protein
VPAQDGLASSAGLAVPLRNGSFESGLDPWTVSGKGVVAPEAKRGRVFQAVSASTATTLVQPIGVDVQKAPAATLSLDYKVAGGEGRVRVLVAYDDAAGKARTSTLEVTGGRPARRLDSLDGRRARAASARVASEGDPHRHRRWNGPPRQRGPHGTLEA